MSIPSQDSDSSHPLEEFGPFKGMGRRRLLTLRCNEIRPTIRFAHRWQSSSRFLERIVFEYLLVLHFDGSATWNVESERIEAGPRHLLLISPFEPHSLFSHFGICDHISIHFDWKQAFPAWRAGPLGRKPYRVRLDGAHPIPRHQCVVPYDVLISKISEIAILWQKGDDVSRMCADAALFQVLSVLIHRAQAQASPSQPRHAHVDQARIKAAIDLMVKRLADPLKPDELAEEAGLSISRFSFLFRKWTGHSPIEHLNHLRIQKAKELLGNIHLSIKEIAVLCGFDDQYYFSKVFTRFDGLPPSQYRETLLANNQNND